jgi:DNA-binding NtrC family response regulator
LQNKTILIVDDELVYLELLKGLLEDEGYSSILTESDPLKVEHILKTNIVDLILCDIYMPGLDGLTLLEKIISEHPGIPVIMVTAFNDVEIAIKATRLGAYEFITKPPDTDRLFLTIKRALDKQLLELERDSLRKSLHSREKSDYPEFQDIITESEKMFRAFDLVKIFASTNETILLSGETGTGKDLIAQKIHDLSPRKDKQFIVVNLASISPTLFESELFGHEKGAFTGATNEGIGYFEASNGGTIFLDEVGELPLELQGKLLRTIQYGEIYRVGNPHPVKLNIRIVAATNRNLYDLVKEKKFRADLYYRLNRGYIALPPLRERGADITILAHHFLHKGNSIYNKNITGFSDSVISALYKYSFPGNVRELENIILNAVAKENQPNINQLIDLPEDIKEQTQNLPYRKFETIDEVVNEHILFVMKSCNNKTSKAAPILGVSERTLQRYIKRLNKITT